MDRFGWTSCYVIHIALSRGQDGRIGHIVFFFVVVSFGQAVRERRGAFARWASQETEEVSMPGGWGFDEMLRHPLMNGVNGVNGVNDYIL